MFKIIKYIQPIWYFNLSPGHDYGYFPTPEFIKTKSNDLKPDLHFSDYGGKMELSYRANRLGIINAENNSGTNWWAAGSVTIFDEYLFARKYFPHSRVILALVFRILSFHNPFSEIAAFIKSAKMKKVNLKNDTNIPKGFDNFPYKFISKKPLVTIVIPTLNRYGFLSDALNDLEKQDYQNFEVIVVDQSEPFQNDFYKRFLLNLKVYLQQEKALWLARNTAIKKSEGEFIAFAEDDIRIPSDWITNHLKCIEFFEADISNGIFFPKGEQIPADRNFFRYADQFATGNAMVKKNVFHKTGLFDRQYEKQRMGDGEFGLRAYRSGFKSIMNPLAWCEDLKAATGGLRESGNWDAFRPKNIWAPRPVPSVLYFYRKYFGTKASILSLLVNIPPSIVPYRFKRNKKMLFVGSLLSILLMPIILIQVIRSWRKSSIMLNNPMIISLND